MSLTCSKAFLVTILILITHLASPWSMIRVDLERRERARSVDLDYVGEVDVRQRIYEGLRVGERRVLYHAEGPMIRLRDYSDNQYVGTIGR